MNILSSATNHQKQNAPLVSIVMPSLNQGRFIEESIKSVMDQDYPSIELIVMDGGSTDETQEIVTRLTKAYPTRLIRWFSEPDTGPANAVNKAMSKARGIYIGWLNSDDLYTPGAVSRAVSAFEANPNWVMHYGQGEHINEQGGFIEAYPTLPPDTPYEKFTEGCFICQPTVFFKRSAITLIGKLDESLKMAFDFDYWLRAFKKLGERIGFVNQVQAESRLHSNCLTVKQREAGSKEAHELILKYTGFSPSELKLPNLNSTIENLNINRQLGINEYESGITLLQSTPSLLTIETTSRCNLRCVMCPHGINAVDRPKHMNESLAKKLQKFLNRGKHVQLHGIGEPLNSPIFWEMLESISEDCDASINTNLTTPDINKLHKLSVSNIKVINVSLDAARPETYQKIRGANLSSCLENIKTLVSLVKQSKTKKNIYINMTLMKSNINEIIEFLDLAKNYEVDGVWLWHLNKWPDQEMSRYVVKRDGWIFDYSKEGLWNYPTLSNQKIAEAFEHANAIQIPLYTSDNKSLLF